MEQLRTEIEIDARPAAVWAVLVDLERHAEWNPFLVQASGEVREGERLRVRLSPPGGRAITMRPRVTVADEARTFEWLGHLGVRGLFDGRHRFDLEPLGDGRTRLVQSETFTGLLVPLLARFLEAKTRAGFVAMNEALRARVEVGLPAIVG
jgi:hypothetical protein